MVRIKAAVARKLGRKRLFRRTKGFYGHKKNRWGQAIRAVIKAMRYSTADRRTRAGDFRSLWITRVNAACKANDIAYSRLVKGLKEANVTLNRKMLSEIAIHDAAAFTKIADIAKKALPKNVTQKKKA